MALVRYDFRSEKLLNSANLIVVLPEGPRPEHGHPVLYLLHGFSEDNTGWTRFTDIERVAQEAGLAVVMPHLGRSWYCDERYGQPYWTYLTQEVPQRSSDVFGLSQRREDTFVAGLSMGGYGAFKWALREPHRFCGAVSLSGALFMPQRAEDFYGGDGAFQRQNYAIWGGELPAGSPDDLMWLLDSSAQQELPQLYAACGTEDGIYRETELFRQEVAKRGITLHGKDTAGAHDWTYWDSAVNPMVEWISEVRSSLTAPTT